MINNKILIVWTGEWPWDIRIEKQIETLKKAGYNISICARNTNNLPEFENDKNISIYRFSNIIKKNALLSNILSTPFYINPLWTIHILKTILKSKPNIMIVRDIPLFLTCSFFSKIFKIKIVLDMAEHWPAQIKVNKKYVNNWFMKLLFCQLDWYKHIEKKSVKKADKIIVVVNEQKIRLLSDYQLNSEKICVVGNTPNKNILYERENNPKESKLEVVYTGGIDGLFRGIQTLVETAKILKNRNNQNIIINIIGDGSYLDYFKNKAEFNHLNNINFLGRQTHSELLNFLKSQDIGIVPHIKCDIIDYTIPNKLFDYMAYSLPVIVSSAKPLKRIVEETNCGWFFESENAEDLADLLQQILENKNELKTKAVNGYNAVKNKYNWENDGKILSETINTVAEGI